MSNPDSQSFAEFCSREYGYRSFVIGFLVFVEIPGSEDQRQKMFQNLMRRWYSMPTPSTQALAVKPVGSLERSPSSSQV